MIGRIRGTLLEKQPPRLLVEAGGLGYEVEAPMSVFYRLPETGVEVVLYTHFVVREDAQLLYGFSDASERELFRILIRINGVGPKLGLTILSGIETRDFVRCVHDGDSSSLVKLPGVGKKTAERLIVELKDKLSQWQANVTVNDGLAGTPLGQLAAKQSADIEQEAVSALVALGYKPQDASKVISNVYTDGMTSEALIRHGLKSML